MRCRVVAEHPPELTAEVAGDLVGPERASELRAFVEALCRRDAGSLVRLDLGALSWIDIDGVQALFLLRRRAAEAGKRLVVANAGGWVQKKLRQTGVLACLLPETAARN